MQSDRAPYWVAVQVRPNHEASTARHLAVKDCEYFLPLSRPSRPGMDAPEKCRPLFQGYLFCRYDENRRGTIVSTPGVIRILGWGGKPQPVDDKEVEAIQRMVASGLDCRPKAEVQAGQRVSIHTGPLCGLEGLVVGQKEGTSRFAVSVSLLNRSVEVEISSGWLTPLEPQRVD